MENVYQLGEKFYRISEAYDCASDALAEEYENNGGEVTETTERMQSEVDELARLKREVVDQVLSAPDDYAAIVKNAEAQKRVLEAELKAVKEEQAKVLARIEARIKRKERKIAWFKENIHEAMKLAEIEKICGARTENRFTIYIKKSESIQTDDEVLLKPFEARIKELTDSLPSWITVKTGISKVALKDEENLPDGATVIPSETIQIR